MLLFGFLFLPVSQAGAKSIEVSSSTFSSTTVSSTISEINDWTKENLGMDLYQIVNKIIEFTIKVLKISINVLLEILPKIRDFLSEY